MITKAQITRRADMRLIEDLFLMHGGTVLDFSNRTFAEFFTDELGVDIYDDRWEADGASKAKRLRRTIPAHASRTSFRVSISSPRHTTSRCCIAGISFERTIQSVTVRRSMHFSTASRFATSAGGNPAHPLSQCSTG